MVVPRPWNLGYLPSNCTNAARFYVGHLPQVHFKHVSKVGSTSYGDLLIDVASTGWDPVVIKAECFDLREVRYVLVCCMMFFRGWFDLGWQVSPCGSLRSSSMRCMLMYVAFIAPVRYCDILHRYLLCGGRGLQGG